MAIAANYTQVKVSIDPATASAFKKACAASNVSMASEIARFMSGYPSGPIRKGHAPDYSTRRRRRAAIKIIIGQLERMMSWEEMVRDNMPENLQGSSAYEAAEEAIASLENAIEALSEY